MSDTEETSRKSRHEAESKLAELKMRKSRAKAGFTRIQNRLVHMLSEESTPEELKDTLDNLEQAMDVASAEITKVADWYRNESRTDDMIKTVSEIDKLNEHYEETMVDYHAHFKDDVSETEEKTTKSPNPSTDMYKQLKRVSIPVFSGVNKDFEFWWSAFTACVDSTNATPEYKFLQLRQYLGGAALKAIEGLGHSAGAYEAAKERLVRKVVGTRRKVNRYLEELDNFPTMKDENAKNIEKFADLLDLAIINMHESDEKDLSSKYMCLHLLKKLPEPMITIFKRWRFENEKEESLEELKEWILRESEFKMIAMETKHGLDSKERQDRPPYAKGHRALFSKPNQDVKTEKQCSVCKGSHGLWECQTFKALPTASRWEKAKALTLCFRCLGQDHSGRDCKRTRKCNIGGCSRVHHRLLHAESAPWNYRKNAAASESNASNSAKSPEMSHSNTYVSKSCSEKCIALRTVPVILKKRDKSVQINALLDDGSTRTYINEELGVQTQPIEMTVNVLNGISDTFHTMPVQVGIESLSGQVKMVVDASTTKNVTGSLKTINWNDKGKAYPHLTGIRFPLIQNRKKVDMLIGSDYAELHYSLHEIQGKPHEPIARLTPLGWTCVGPYADSKDQNSFNTFFMKEAPELVKLNSTLKKFWENDTAGTLDKAKTLLSVNEKVVLEKTEKSVSYDSGHSTVGIPWKEETVKLPNNYSAALKRVGNTEKKLKKNPEVLSEYQKTIQNYEKKGYVTKVEQSESSEVGWFLPHFPVIRFDKATPKVRVVLDASAKYENISLNDKIDQSPKLQRELFDVLLRFRRHEVAIICDIQEMYLRVGIIESDRKFHRFLWRSDPDEPPEIHEVNRVVFGVNASPFLAQFIAQRNAKELKMLIQGRQKQF